MDLWIRSQEREILYKVNSSLRVKQMDITYHNFENIKCFIECDGHKIAMYETRERALEVLNEIQKFIAGTFEVKNLNYTEADIFLKSKIFENMIKIYNMPKE